ncbi:MAG: hypothetical protein FJ144_00245 [Deltaproteobacteria bacterium]|nr:hypothetical protein [Deltaproteobacteria bacterium]
MIPEAPSSRGGARGLAPVLAAVCTIFTACLASSRPVSAQSTVAVPGDTGDQLIFFFDGRTDRVPFVTVANPASEPVTIEIAFYPTSLDGRLGQSVRILPGRGNRVINPTEEAGGVGNGQAGLLVVTPVRSESELQPVVPPLPLTGGYTVANTSLGGGLGAAFGDSPMGRRAVGAGGNLAVPGTVVDGAATRYQRFTPDVLLVPAYYDPETLDPPEKDGNRVILAAFVDRYGSRFDLGPNTVQTRATLAATEGNVVSSRDLVIDGVLLSDLQSIAGGTALVSSGKAFFETGAAVGSVFGIFSQSLAAFGAGARMPAVDRAPPPGPTPAPTTTGSPGPTPGSTPGAGACGNGVIDGFEGCDGADLDDALCEDVVFGKDTCTGSLACTDACTFDATACVCGCVGDFDCDVEIDCTAFVPGCTVFGACQNGTCVTNPIGTAAVCNGTDPEFGDPRCE